MNELYIQRLQDMIAKKGHTEKDGRMSKLRRIYEILKNPLPTISLSELMKVESVLQKLFDSTAHVAPSTMHETTAEMLTPEQSPSPPDQKVEVTSTSQKSPIMRPIQICKKRKNPEFQDFEIPKKKPHQR